MRLTSYNLELGTILRKVPDSWHFGPRLVVVETAYAFGWANGLWSRSNAVRIATLAAFESVESYGHGNRYKRRAGIAVPDTREKEGSK